MSATPEKAKEREIHIEIQDKRLIAKIKYRLSRLGRDLALAGAILYSCFPGAKDYYEKQEIAAQVLDLRVQLRECKNPLATKSPNFGGTAKPCPRQIPCNNCSCNH